MRSSFGGRDIDYDKAKADRDFRLNPPESAPGQGSFDFWNVDVGGSNGMDNNMNMGAGDDLFSGLGAPSTGAPNQNDWSGGSTPGANDILNNGAMGVNPMMAQQQMQQPRKQFEDVLEDAVVIGGKVTGKALSVFFNEFVEAVKDNQLRDTYDTCVLCCWSGLIMMAASLVFIILSSFSTDISSADALITFLSGALVGVGGFGCVAVLYNRIKEERQEASDVGDELEEAFAEENNSSNDFSFPGEDTNSNDSFDFGDEDEEDLFSNWDEEEEFDDERVVGGIYEEDINVDSLVEDIQNGDVPVGMYTRQYLFETFTKVLPLNSPNFSSMSTVSEGSELFLDFEDMIREAASLKGVDEDYLPNLIELRKNLFMYQLKVDRSKGCIGKEDAIANEVVEMYKRDENGQVPEERAKVYSTTSSVGSIFYINLFTGACPLITLGDIFNKEKEFILDPKNKMPFIWGTNEFGKVWKCDVGKTNSYIISGVPRGGKSWKVQSMLVQLCMFSSPDEVNIHVCDVKANTSDYYIMSREIPHFKSFSSTKDSILSKLRHLTNEEAERRRGVLKKYGFINIADLKKKRPDVTLPYLYIVVDEMQSLSKRMDKDEKNEFQGYLSRIISELPNLGFRVILVPHRIVNYAVSKEVYPLVTCRASIRQTFEEIKNGLEITRKEFPYNLPAEGDMALRTMDINGNSPIYCHGEAITSSNEMNNEVYRFVGSVWKRLCPGCDKDMVGANEPYISREPVDRSIEPEEYDDDDFVSTDSMLGEEGEVLDNFWE